MQFILIGCLIFYAIYVICKALDQRDRQIQDLENARTAELCATIRDAAVAQSMIEVLKKAAADQAKPN